MTDKNNDYVVNIFLAFALEPFPSKHYDNGLVSDFSFKHMISSIGKNLIL